MLGEPLLVRLTSADSLTAYLVLPSHSSATSFRPAKKLVGLSANSGKTPEKRWRDLHNPHLLQLEAKFNTNRPFNVAIATPKDSSSLYLTIMTPSGLFCGRWKDKQISWSLMSNYLPHSHQRLGFS